MANDQQASFGLRHLWGIILIPLCVFVALSLFSYDWRDISTLRLPPNDPTRNMIGPVGAWLSFALLMTFGIGAYLLPVGLLALSVILLASRQDRVWPRAVWGAVSLFAFASVFSLHHGVWEGVCGKLNLRDSGGFTGYYLMEGMLVRWLSPIGAGLIAWTLALGAMVMFIGLRHIVTIGRGTAAFGRWTADRIREFRMEHTDALSRIEIREREVERKRKRIDKDLVEQERMELDKDDRPKEKKPREEDRKVRIDEEPPRREKERVKDAEPEPVVEAKPEPDREEAPPPEEHKPKIELPPPREKAPPRPPPPPRTMPLAGGITYTLPPITLLSEPGPDETKNVEADLTTMARILTETLAEFGIEGEVKEVNKGPVVTRFEFLPAAGVRVERIGALSNNLALSLKATSIRVQAPIPGKGLVGIEVPNSSSTTVFLREILESEDWQTSDAHLPLALGKDVSGKVLLADLADMPHMLIAGATGAGKTVCMNSVLAGLLMARTPDQLRLLLVDPKIVEFGTYKDLPHLVVPVVTQPQKVALALRWAINEMERRYKLFAKIGVRNIETFNTREVAKQPELFQDAAADPATPPVDETPARLPYIVIVVDELADLMLTAQADIENCIARLAQLSRAVGIHMILSTQRPSVNVITGTIKANFPARLAFQVAQKVDSRTILDSIGAEKLLGKGDMLFQPPGVSKLTRAQGAFTTDAEVNRITDYIRSQAQPSYEMEIKEKIERPDSGSPGLDGEEDEAMLEQSIQIIRETQRASTSSLQRRLRIGYTRAARIMDILEERGIVGPPQGSDPREILIDLDGQIPDNSAPEDESKPPALPG